MVSHWHPDNLFDIRISHNESSIARWGHPRDLKRWMIHRQVCALLDVCDLVCSINKTYVANVYSI